MKKLFNDDETYTSEASILGDKMRGIAYDLFNEFSDFPTRDVLQVMHDAFDLVAVETRVRRQMENRRNGV